MIRIYADFNSQDEAGRVYLNTAGSLEDIRKNEDLLHDGARVLLYMEDEFEVEANLAKFETWMAVPDMKTYKKIGS